MDRPDFIVPPPGLIPSRVGERTVPAASIAPASFPVFVPGPLGGARPAAAVHAQPPPRDDAPPGWWLTFADGQRVEATVALVIGRDPAPVATRPHATLQPVTDAAKSVSKTHAIIDMDGDRLSVTDLNSTNGVIVTEPDGTQTDLEPGGRAQLRAGARLMLGEFVIDVGRR